MCFYRRPDLEALTARLEAAGHYVEPINWDQGHGYADRYVDRPPYFQTPLHLRLISCGFTCTSFGLIVHKGPHACSTYLGWGPGNGGFA